MICQEHRQLLTWEDGGLSEERAASMQEHVAGCRTCAGGREDLREVLDAARFNSETDSDAYEDAGLSDAIMGQLSASPVLTQPVGARRRWLGFGLSALACAIVVVLWPASDDGFRERTAATAIDSGRWVGLRIFALDPSTGRATRVRTHIDPDALLLFSYANLRGDNGYLSVVGRDAAGQIHWYYPATDHGAMAIQREATGVELPDAIQKPLAHGPLDIIGLFSEVALDRSTVAQWVKTARRGSVGPAQSIAHWQRLSVDGAGD